MKNNLKKINNKKELIYKLKSLNIPFYDLHTHSISKYTDDYVSGNMPPSNQIIDAAEQFGLRAFGISDHSYEIVKYDDLDEPTILNNKFNSFVPYLKYLEDLRKTRQIPLLKGTELYVDKPEHIDKIDKKTLDNLDFIILETRKKLSFSEIRKKLGNNITLILAHPTVESIFDEKTEIETISNWLSELKNNNIHFELNRSNFKQYLERTEFYQLFFNLAKEKNIKFSIGSDYHKIPGDYLKFYISLCQIAELYKINNFYVPNVL